MLPHHLELEFITTPELRQLQHVLERLGHTNELEEALHWELLQPYFFCGIEHAVTQMDMGHFIDSLLVWGSTPQGGEFWSRLQKTLHEYEVAPHAPA